MTYHTPHFFKSTSRSAGAFKFWYLYHKLSKVHVTKFVVPELRV